jgi:hypothetical protein
MTALDGNLGAGTLGGTLAATLGTLQGGTLGGGNTKKVSKAFGNAWRGAAAYHYYMLALKQFYEGGSLLSIPVILRPLIVMRYTACGYYHPLQATWTQP